MNKLLCAWGKRNLSIVGNKLIIKSLILPLFTFLASVCLVPDTYHKEIEKKCFKFIWNGKPDKVKRNQLIPAILYLQFFSLPIHIPSALFLFNNKPENEPNISISFISLIIFIDFSKAFDSLEWDFMLGTLKHFRFNESFIS
jgi:hypothetical protein